MADLLIRKNVHSGFPCKHYLVTGLNITFLDFFQIDTFSRKQKGIVGVDLASDPMLNHL